MRKFTFRLEPILDLKESLERVAQVELGKLEAAHRDAVAELKRLRQHRAGQLGRLSDHHRQLRLNVRHIESYVEYLSVIEQRIRDQEEVIEQLTRRVAGQRENLIARMKEKKVLQKLKERHKSTYDEKVLRQEEKQADEVVTTHLGRGRVMGGA